MKELIRSELFKLRKLPSVRMIFLFAFITGIIQGFSPLPGYQVYIVSLGPELSDIILISVFTVIFLCTEFSNRTYGNAFLCGISRQTVFSAKLAVYFPALLVLILLPMTVSVSVTTMRNGFGTDWDTVTGEIAATLLSYILYRFFMAGLAILAGVVIQNQIGTLGISIAGIYIITIIKPLKYPATQTVLICTILQTAIILFVTARIFIRRELS